MIQTVLVKMTYSGITLQAGSGVSGAEAESVMLGRGLGNGSAHGLTAQQTLEVKTMVDEAVEKSESRVLLALNDIRADMRDFRSEVKAEISDVRSEISDVRSEISDVRSEISGLRSEVSSVNRRVDTLVDGLAEVKTDLKVGMKDLKVRLHVSVLVLLVITLAFPGAARDLLIPLLSRSSP